VTRYVELSPGTVTLRDGPAPAVPTGWARVSVSACGICGTDLHLLEGMRLPPGASYPLQPGHEVCGTVAELGDGGGGPHAIEVGMQVVLHPLAPCGSCEVCVSGDPEQCASKLILGIHLPGGLATELVWPVSRMVSVPGVDARRAAVLADAVATANSALDAARLPPGGALCVIGAGGVGTHVLELARIRDPKARLVGVVRSPASAERLTASGFDAVVGLDSGPLRERGPYHAVVDFSGDPAGPEFGLKLLRPRGVYVFGSVLEGDLHVGAAQRVQARELTITGVVASTMTDLRVVADLATSGALDLGPSITHEFGLSEVAAAFQTLRDRPPGMVRTVVNVGPG